MEYAYNDFAIAQVARVLGREAIAGRYLARSGSWANLWDKESLSIRPRHADGSWMTPFDRKTLTMSWMSPFYEGTPWQYSTFVPHDVDGLIERVGGAGAFVAWLDRFFAEGQYDPGNEPGFLAPWLFIHAGRPDRTQAIVRDLLERHFHPGRAGLPGNDDAGAMSAWYVWSSIGLYPNAGQAYYYIGSPVFTRTILKLGGGKAFAIIASGASSENRFVQSATLNGEPLDRPWLSHRDIADGGVLRVIVGPKASRWGSRHPPASRLP